MQTECNIKQSHTIYGQNSLACLYEYSQVILYTLTESQGDFLTMATIQPVQRTSSNVVDTHGLHNDNAVPKGINLAHEMRYLFRAMGVVGMYHTPKGWLEPTSSTLSNSLHLLHKFYCILMQIYVWSDAIRMSIGVFNGDDVTVSGTNYYTLSNLIVWLYYLQAAVNVNIFYYICSSDCLAKCIDYWQTYCELSHSDKTASSISLSSTWFRRRMWMITVIILFTFMSCNLVAIGVDILSKIEAVHNDTYKDAPLFSTDSLVWKVFIQHISLVYTSLAYFCPLIIIIIFCITFSHQYELLTQSFVSTMVSSDDIKQYLNLFRIRHQQLCKSVFLADRTFSFYLATLTCSNICMLCFCLFQIVIKDKRSVGSVHLSTTLLTYMIVLTILYLIVSVFAARLHDNVSIEEFISFSSNLFSYYIQCNSK